MIIALNGYAGSGKDEMGNIIQYLSSPAGKLKTYEEFKTRIKNPTALGNVYQSNWVIKKWAGKLKQIASILTNIPISSFEDQDFKKTELGKEWDNLEELMSCNCGKFLDYGHKDGKCINCKKSIIKKYSPMTIRELLQRLGTDAMRDGLHINTWVNALMSEYKMKNQSFDNSSNWIEKEDGYPNWIITDTRFPNEAQAVKDKGGIIIRINRNGVNPINNHPSEVGLDNWSFDHIIENNGTIIELIDIVKDLNIS